jgi:hypothetical protein
MAKLNCWESKKCGQEASCPAAKETKLEGVNSGKNAGRSCWTVSGTLLDGKPQGSFASKLSVCSGCEFFRQVRQEEGAEYQASKEILEKLKGK